MMKLFFEIRYSSINFFEENELYKISIIRKIGSGSYGSVFVTSFYNTVIKIIDNNDTGEYTDKSEYDVCHDIIKKNSKVPELFCKYYAIGYITKDFIYSESTKFKSGAKAIFMPLYIKLSRYIYSTSRTLFSKEHYLCNIAKKILESQIFFLEMGYINVDIKFANIMLDTNLNLKFIDFGMCKYNKTFENEFTVLDNYYIWPKVEKIKYDHLIVYMITIFLFEIIFGSDVFDINKTNNSQIFRMNILNSRKYTQEFKEYINDSLSCTMGVKDSLNKLNIIINKYHYNLYKTIPNEYSKIIQLHGFQDYNNLD